MEAVIILVLALVIDLIVGDPPNLFHPVAWLGKLISAEVKFRPKRQRRQLFYGIAMVILTLAAVSAPVYFGLGYLKTLNQTAYILVAAVLLKLTFSVSGLRQAALDVKGSLSRNNLDKARKQLSALVSRDTACLSREQTISATVESVAENSCDSLVAPLFFFLILGVPGAVLYRVVNTYDAMIGYHGRWEYLGKFAARFDDVLNFIPSRLTGVLITLVSFSGGGRISRAWEVMGRDHQLTESPNAGWTMSAAAGALGIRLEKTGCYCLGDNLYPLTEKTIDASLHILTAVTVLWGTVCLLVEVMAFAF